MAKLTLVYGMRLLPAEEVEEVGEGAVKLKNGRDALKLKDMYGGLL